MSDNFKTCDEAWQYCKKYNLDNIAAAYSFSIAEALLRAYKDGVEQSVTASDSEGRAVLEETDYYVENVDADTIRLIRCS